VVAGEAYDDKHNAHSTSSEISAEIEMYEKWSREIRKAQILFTLGSP